MIRQLMQLFILKQIYSTHIQISFFIVIPLFKKQKM